MKKYWQRILLKWTLIVYLVMLPIIACYKLNMIYLGLTPICFILAYRIFKMKVYKKISHHNPI